ncbi:hypothetical protein [Agrobacterium tumefaciens]|uniref:hypothetical protein n=1 Tax=Agrobacterium tumefaciens TaxID=358 RepID=UPI00287E066E|nr:hypothetical protein [Agrobacterium tumefaciens]MDS7597249.1 hypothetical protein [Agrobacterium tumefaciens]
MRHIKRKIRRGYGAVKKALLKYANFVDRFENRRYVAFKMGIASRLAGRISVDGKRLMIKSGS